MSQVHYHIKGSFFFPNTKKKGGKSEKKAEPFVSITIGIGLSIYTILHVGNKGLFAKLTETSLEVLGAIFQVVT